VNVEVTPAGRDVAVMFAVKFPELPDPEPRLTVTGYVTLPAVPKQREPDWAPTTAEPTFGESVKMIWALSPEVSPAAVSVYVVPRSSSSTRYSSLRMFPSESARAARTSGACSTGDSSNVRDTVSPGIHPEPVTTTKSPGE